MKFLFLFLTAINASIKSDVIHYHYYFNSQSPAVNNHYNSSKGFYHSDYQHPAYNDCRIDERFDMQGRPRSSTGACTTSKDCQGNRTCLPRQGKMKCTSPKDKKLQGSCFYERKKYLNSVIHRCKRLEENNSQGNMCFNDADCLLGRSCVTQGNVKQCVGT